MHINADIDNKGRAVYSGNNIQCILATSLHVLTVGNIGGSVSSPTVGGGVAAAIIVMLLISAIILTVFVLYIKTRKMHSQSIIIIIGFIR